MSEHDAKIFLGWKTKKESYWGQNRFGIWPDLIRGCHYDCHVCLGLGDLWYEMESKKRMQLFVHSTKTSSFFHHAENMGDA